MTQNESPDTTALEDRIHSPPVLAFQRHDDEYTLDADTSNVQVGCVLLQQQKDGTNRPNGYRTDSLNDAPPSYNKTCRKCYAVAGVALRLLFLAEGTMFTIRTDHDSFK